MIGRKGWPLAQMWAQKRVGQLTGLGIEVQDGPDAGVRRAKAGPDPSCVRFVQ